jgi:hypothetical protein
MTPGLGEKRIEKKHAGTSDIRKCNFCIYVVAMLDIEL